MNTLILIGIGSAVIASGILIYRKRKVLKPDEFKQQGKHKWEGFAYYRAFRHREYAIHTAFDTKQEAIQNVKERYSYYGGNKHNPPSKYDWRIVKTKGKYAVYGARIKAPKILKPYYKIRKKLER